MSSVLYTHGCFAFFVAIAVCVQNLTGFAFALILLGLVGLTDLVPLPDAVSAVTVLIIVNAVVFLYRRRPVRLEPAMKPTIVASLLGAVLGIGILAFLAAHAFSVLKALLGLCIVGCAILLWRSAKPLALASGCVYFTIVGALSGVLGGIFSAAGPPLVYAVYRQPWPVDVIRESLIFCFGVGAAFRLLVMILSGLVSAQAMWLALEAIPVVFLVTFLTANLSVPISKNTLKHIVCVLLICAGVGMLL
ncbi:sulfite exporter TauE/SafE family protein [Candidimonas nitroreducens]|uniref:sulfite exporter TauE/SafE family protein n=1 Tax=Candidimonas nitroreducens TaxID=683354 RepID=UPI001E58A279|nr:sulfite exporter TauE/SafE family protein [Candidimonas nitroreducens]